jgi:hypothetical protein
MQVNHVQWASELVLHMEMNVYASKPYTMGYGSIIVHIELNVCNKLYAKHADLSNSVPSSHF